MSWTSRLIIHSFRGIDLEFVNGEWKKKPRGMREKWNEITESSIKKSDKGLGLLTGTKSGVLVLDFDTLDLYSEYTMKYCLKDVPRVTTRKGVHLYFLWNDKYTELPSKLGKLDIQGNGKQVFFPGTEYKTETGDIFTYSWEHETDSLCELPNELFQDLKSSSKKKVTTKQTDFVIECNDTLWKDIIENIAIRFIDEYQSWFQIVCGLFAVGRESDNVDHYKEVSRSLSMKSKKYDKSHKEFERMWECCGKYSYTGGSIRHYSRESNEVRYLEICKRHSGKDREYLVFDEKLLCDYFIESYGDNLICCKGRVYIYLNGNWKEDTKGNIIMKFLKQEITNLYKRIIDSLNKSLQDADADSEAITKKMNNAVAILTAYGHQKNKNIWGLIYCELISRDIDKDIFDTKKNLFVFNNKAYDFDTSNWVRVSKFDYILTSCGKDYIEPTKQQMDTVTKLFESVFPNPEYRKAYGSILKSGLSGTRVEKFVVATGGGRNGKGAVNDFFGYLLGQYYGILHLNLLTKEIKAGANTELRNVHKKRFLKATEPDSGSFEKLRMSNIKAITGENNLKARGLYENDFDIQIDATIILECNKLPFISMDGNEAEKQRMIIIPFDVCFTDNQEDILKNPDKYQPQDPYIKTEEYKESNYCALFKYLVDVSPGLDLYIPDACKQLALQWMLDKDDFVGWLFENYQEEPGALVSIKELYRDFKGSSFYYKMNRTEQKQNNEKSFREMIQGKLKHLYVPARSYVDGRQVTKDSIKGYSKKPFECDSDTAEIPE